MQITDESGDVLMDKQCGNNLPAPVTYTGPGNVNITFYTDFSVTEVGWKLVYNTTQEGNYRSHCCLLFDVVLKTSRIGNCFDYTLYI